ncbi:MAG: hypothetical protein Q9169_007030 [Polycauliona sp. 2 TL-2023]
MSQSSLTQQRTQSVDLWQKALTTLDDDLRASLDFKNSTKRDILEKTLRTAQEKKQLSLKRRWKVKIKGKELIVRDILEKIIKWLDHFKAIGDIAVQYDQAHAALPWAGVRFLLQASASDSISHETLNNRRLRLETVAHCITRYAIFEQVYAQRNTTASSELESALTALYAELLTFLAKAKRYFQTPTASRMLKSALTAFESDENQQLERIISQDAKVSAIATLSDAEILNRLQWLERPVHRIADQAVKYAETLEGMRYREIMDWLSPIRYIEHQKWHSGRRLRGTGQWLLDDPEYLGWLSSSASSIFLLHGMAGSGKTMLASAVVDSFLGQLSSQGSSALLAYFYCSKSASDINLSDPEEIMRSIVRQLCFSGGAQKTIHPAVLRDYEQRESEAKLSGFDVSRLNVHDCVRLIVATTGADPAIVVIDAIDEVQPKGRYELFTALQQTVKDSSSIVKILVTSRNDDQVFCLLDDAPTLRIGLDHQRADVQAFVHDQIALAVKSNRLLGGTVSSQLRADLSQALINSAEEIFLLVLWQIDKLCDMRHETDVREAMRRFSRDTLDQLYSEMLENIRSAGEYSCKLAFHAFSLLLCLQEPLSPTSFFTALAFMDGEHGAVLQIPQVLRICFNLIVVDAKMNVLRFAHSSVREFLDLQTDFASHKTHGRVAKSCLNSMFYSSPVEIKAGISSKDHFYHYSILYWAEHCAAVFVSGEDSKLVELLEEFIFEDGTNSLAFIGWLKDVQEYTELLPRHHSLKKKLSAVSSQDQALLFTVCVFGLAPLLNHIIKFSAVDWNRKNDSGQTALYLACSLGHVTVARFLLEHGADANVGCGRLGTPLQAACFQGHIDIVRLLFENGADMTARGLFQNALEASTKGNHQEIAMLLLQNGFTINGQDQYDQALQEASQTGFVEVVDYLRKTYRSSFDSSPIAESRSIQAAIGKGHLGILGRLMKGFSDPKAELPPDSIATAASGGHDNIVRMLLDQGLDIEHEGQYGRPLRSASLFGHDSTVQLLLSRGAKVSADSFVGNALEAAVISGHGSIVSSLVQEGIDVNIKGGTYGTALQAAAYQGHLNITKILLDAGANVYSAGIAKDAFHAAAESGHEETIKLLLARGYKVYDRIPMELERYRTASPPKFQDLLRASSPSRREQNHTSRTPDLRHLALEKASSNGHLGVVKTILSAQTDYGIRVSAENIESSMYKASTNGRQDIIECFLSRDLDVAPYLTNVLNAAARTGHLGIVQVITTYYESLSPTDGQLAGVGDLVPKQLQQMPSALAGDLLICVQIMATHCANFEKDILVPGCRGDHVPIVKEALELIRLYCHADDTTGSHRVVLYESSKHNSHEVMDYIFGVSQYNEVDLLQAIELSCEHGSVQTLRILLLKYPHDLSRINFSKGVSSPINVRFQNEQTQVENNLLKTLDYRLYSAASKNHVEVVKILIEEGASIEPTLKAICNSPDKWASRKMLWTIFGWTAPTQTPLEAALFDVQTGFGFELMGSRHEHVSAEAKLDREKIILILLEHSRNTKNPNMDLDKLLDFGIRHFSDHFVSSVISYGASLLDSDSGRMSALRAAASREVGAAAVMDVLLRSSGYPIDSQSSPGEIPETSGLVPIIDTALELFDMKRLCSKRFNQYSRSVGQFRRSKSIHDVLYTGPGAVIKMLLQHLPMQKVEDDRYGHLLQMAVAVDNRGWAKLLLERGVNVNAKGYYYGTALQCAARFGNVHLVELLLSKGAKVNICNGEHGSALRAAIIRGHEEVVDVLLQHNAEANQCDGVNLRTTGQGDRSPKSEHLIHLALDSRNLTILRSLAAAGTDLQPKMCNQPPALITACRTGSLEMVRFLLGHNVDVNPPKRRSWEGYRFPGENMMFQDYYRKDERASALHLACSEGYVDIAQLLLEHGADSELEIEVIEAEGYSSKTPLQMAAHSGHLHMVQLLINTGATIDYCNSHGTALSIASSQNKLEIVRELLLLGASIVDPLGGWDALASACRARCHAVVELLVEELPEVLEERACTDALSAAVSGGHDDISQMLLAQNIPISSSALSQACGANLFGSVSLLLSRGVDIDGDDGKRGRALHAASFGQSAAMVDLLLDHGANVNTLSLKYGSSLLAALEGLARKYLGSPPEFSMESSNEAERRVSYHWPPDDKELASCEHIVQALLARGANPNATTRRLGNPLHLASFVGSISIVQQLLDNGAELNSISDRFSTALIAALEHRHQHMDVTEVLLRAGINVNHFSSKYGTALHYACNSQNKDMVRLLLDHGADPNSTSSSHGSPLTACISRHISQRTEQSLDKDIAEIILRRGNYTKVAEQDLLIALDRIPPLNAYGKPSAELSYGEELVRILLEHDKSLRATEAVLITAIEHLGFYGTDTLQCLLQRNGGEGVTNATIEAVKDPDHLKLLLNHRPICKITPEVMSNFFKNYWSSTYSYRDDNECELLRLLLNHEPSLPVPSAITSLLLSTSDEKKRPQDLIKFFYERDKELRVTETMIKETRTPKVMEVLLKHAPFFNVTPELLLAVGPAGEPNDTARRRKQQYVSLLLAHDKTAIVSRSLASTFLPDFWSHHTLDYVKVLLDRGPDLPLPSEFPWLLIKEINNRGGSSIYKKHLQLFIEHNKTIDLTDDLRMALEKMENLDSEIKSLLYAMGVK